MIQKIFIIAKNNRMRKPLAFLFILLASLSAQAQSSRLDELLSILEAKKGLRIAKTDVDISDKKFVLIKDFDEYTERNFIILKDNLVTMVEVFDDKKTGETTSKIFTGDMVRTNKNLISIRLDKQESKPLSVPLTKALLLAEQKQILYLLDLNTKERWIDESSLTKKN